MSPVMVRSCRTERIAPQLGQSKLGIWDKSILPQAQPYGPQSQTVNSLKFREFIEITSEFKNCVERMRGSEKGERRKEILRGKRPTWRDLRGDPEPPQSATSSSTDTFRRIRTPFAQTRRRRLTPRQRRSP